MELPGRLPQFNVHPEKSRAPLTIPLRLVLIVPFLLLTVGTVGLVGYLCIRNGQQTVESFANRFMGETGDRVNLYLQDYLKTPQLINRLNANAVQLDQLDIRNPKSLERHFVQQIQAFDSVSRIHFSNPQGGFVSAGNDERGLSIATTAEFSNGLLRVYSVDPQGNRTKLLVERSDYDARQRPFFQQAVTVGKPTWGPIYTYVPASIGLGISATYPLYDSTQQLMGVLSSDLTLTAIHDFLANLHVGTHGTIFVVDRSGQMVASSTSEQPFLPSAANHSAERLKAIESEDAAIRLSTQHLIDRFGSLKQIRSTTQLHFDKAGQRQFLQVAPFTDPFGLDWLIVVTVPESDFMGQIHSNTRITILLSAAALLASALLGLWLARWIARPIQRLSRVSRALAAGEWHEAFKADSPITELQALTQSFNQTAEQLQQSFDRVKIALQESEEKFTKVFRTCPEPIAILTLDGQYLEVNQAFIELFGYSRDEIIGHNALEIGQWTNSDDCHGYLQLIQRGERIHNWEFNCQTKSGEGLTLLFSAEGIELQGQRCLLGVAKEITDRKQLEVSLRQQADREQLLRTVTQRMRQSLDLDEILTATVTDVRQTLQADRVLIFHLTSRGAGVVLKESVLPDYPVTQTMLWEDECLSSECYEYYRQGKPRIVPDVTTDRWADCLIDFMQQAGVKSKAVAPITQNTEDGTVVVWGLLIVHACADYRQWQPSEVEFLQQIANQLAIALQQADLYQQVQRELAERKRVEQALRQSEEQNRAVLSAIPDLMVLVSAEGVYLDIVRAGSLIDLIPAEVNPIGKHLTEVVPAEVAATKLYMIKRALATGEVQTLEQQLWLENRWQYEEVRVVACGADTALIMIRDITDRKQVELELRRSRDLREAIFNESADAIFLVELPPRSLILDCNQRAVELFEVTRKAELIGIAGNTLQKRPFTPEELTEIRDTIQQTGFWSQEIEYVTQTGKTFWGNLAAKSISIAGEELHLVRLTDISYRRRAEEALRQSEQLFRGAFETSAFGISIRSPEGKYLRVNQALCNMLGYTEAELLRSSYRDITHPDDLAIDPVNTTQRLLAGEIPYYHLEKRFIHKQGHIVWGLISISLVRDLQDQPLYFVAQVQDITARKQAEAALRDSEARFQKIAAASPAQIYILTCNPDGSDIRFEYISSGVREIQELEPEQVLQNARLTYNQVHPDDRAVYNEVTYYSLQRLEPFSHEWRIITPSGKVKWVQANSRPERRENGEIAWYGVLLDITARKQAEEALRQNEARFQELAAASPAIIYTIEEYPTGPVRFEYLSPAFEEIHELPLADVLENPTLAFQCFHPDDRAGHQQAVAKAAAAMQPFQHTWRIITPSGKIKWLQGSSRPERRENGVLVWHGVVQDVTVLKVAEEALRQSEATLRRAQQVAHIGSWELDLLTEKVKWTEESFHIMGWDITQPEPTLSEFYELLHPDDRAMLAQTVAPVAAYGGAYKTEFRIIRPNGELRYVEARGEAVMNDQGQVVKLLGTNLDITERIQAEDALRQSEATKNQILKAIPDLILWMNTDGTCIDLIDGSITTNLYIKSEAVGKNLYNILPSPLAQARCNAIQQSIQSGEVQIYEQQVIVRGKLHYEEVRVISVGDDRVLVIVRDITDRKQAEAALLDSEVRFRSAFQDAPIGMALIGLDDRWIQVNPMLCDMLGFSESELLSMTASSLVHLDDFSRLQQCIEQVLSNDNRNAQVELRYSCHQGHIAWGLMSLSLVRDAQGQPLYYVAQIQDITERQAIDRMKSEFISIVSHELRTPLTAIRGFLGLLDTGIYDDKPDKAKHMLRQALTNSDRLVRLVNDILDLERLASGRVPLVMEVCEAEDLLQRAVAGVQSIADQAAVTLIIVPTPALVWACPDAIIQTLTNLLSNAIKFSPANAVVTLSANAQPGSVVFSVSDQGRGIPADKLEIIFGRFQQVDVSDSRQKGGTGLGLAICQSIVQQHGGSIWAESTLGEGSTFYFTLPPPVGETP